MSDEFSLSPTRRQLLASLGTGGVLAGGVASFRTMADVVSPIAAQSPQRGTLVGTMTGPTQGLHFNLFGTSSADIPAEMVFDPTVKYHRGRGEFIPAAVTEWTVEGETMTLSLRPDLVWDDGDPVTARDLRTQLLLGKTVDDDLWEYATAVETLGEKRLAVHFDASYNPDLLERIVLGDRRLFVKHEYYEPFLETLRADGEIAAREELMAFTPTSMGEFAASGPFTVDSIDTEGIKLELNPTHPDSDSIGFQSYEFRALLGTDTRFQALETGQVDVIASMSTLPNQPIELPSSVVQVRIPDYWGLGLWPNHDVEPLDDRAVRQAIAFVIDRSAVTQASGRETNQPVETPNGLPASAVADWIAQDSLETYVDPDNEAATDVLSRAGYTREDGTWTAEDGTPLGFSISVPEFITNFVNATDSVAEQLRSFGIEADVREVTFRDIFAGDFDVVSGWWLPGNIDSTHPYVAYRFGFGMGMVQPDLLEYPGLDSTVTVPADGNNGSIDVTPQDELEALATTVDRGEAESIVQRLAKVYNADLPMLPLYRSQYTSFIDTSAVDAPAEGSPKFQITWPPHWLVRTGDLHSPGWAENEASTPTETVTNTPTATDTERETPSATETETTQPTETATESSPSTPSETATKTVTPTATPTAPKTSTATETVTNTPATTETDRSATESRTTTVSRTPTSTTDAESEGGQSTEGNTDGATTTGGPGFGLLSSVAGLGSYAFYRARKQDE